MKRVAILISGGGSNMVRLVESMTGDHPARPVLVVSNVPGAGGLAKAEALGIRTATVDHRAFGRDRAAFEARGADPYVGYRLGTDIVFALDVAAKNRRARVLYERLGFVVEAESPRWFGLPNSNVLRMVKPM